MKKILFLVFAGSLCAQIPQGNGRLRFSMNSNQSISRAWMGPTGSAWFPGDESGNEIFPSYGSMPQLTMVAGTGVNCTDAEFNSTKCAIYLDGTANDYMYQSDSAENSPTSTMTIWSLVKLDSQTNHTLISKWGGGDNAFTMFFGQATASAVPECYLNQSDNTNIIANGGTYTPGVWEAWTCVADGTNWKMYKNGILMDTKSYDGTIKDSGNALIFGTLGAAVYWITGDVAYIDFRKTQISDSQVRQSYQGLRKALCDKFPATGAGTFCTDLPK